MKYYKWVAVMDAETCDRCSEQHNRALSEDEIERFRPPMHGIIEGHPLCRCVLVEIKAKKQDANKTPS